MFEKTKEIIDILEEKLSNGDKFKDFKAKNSQSSKYENFFNDYKVFIQYMSYQYDLCQLSSNSDIELFSNTQLKLKEKSEDFFQFMLRSINNIVNVRPMKFDLFLKLLFFLVEDIDKNDEHYQDLLLENITNRFLICKLYENDYFPFKKLQNYIQKENILFFLVYLEGKITEEEYEEWCQFLQSKMGLEFLEILSKKRKLNETQIELLKTQRENPNQLSIYIRNDDYDNFLNVMSKNIIDFDSKIPNSINEINSIFHRKISPSFINYSAFYGSTKIFRYLVSNGAHCDINTLICACAGGSSEIVRLLNQKNIFFNQKCLNKSIKYFAEIPFIEFILINTELKIGFNEMEKAINSFNFPFFTFFFSEKLIQNKIENFSPILHFSVCANNCQITRFLCELMNNYFDKELINKKDPYKISPLVKAVRAGYFKIVKILIQNGANFNDIDDKILFFFFELIMF